MLFLCLLLLSCLQLKIILCHSSILWGVVFCYLPPATSTVQRLLSLLLPAQSLSHQPGTASCPLSGLVHPPFRWQLNRHFLPAASPDLPDQLKLPQIRGCQSTPCLSFQGFITDAALQLFVIANALSPHYSTFPEGSAVPGSPHWGPAPGPGPETQWGLICKYE